MPTQTNLGKAPTSTERELAALKRRLDYLEDMEAIRETLHRYSHTIDNGPFEAWANVFTEDGVFDVFMIDGRKVHKENGRAELKRYLATKQLPPNLYDKHLIASPVITIKGNTATVESYVILLRETATEGPRVYSWGTYHDTLNKVRGKWLIKERLASMETRTGKVYKGPVKAPAR